MKAANSVNSRSVKIIHLITRMIIGGAQENTLLSATGLRTGLGYKVVLGTGPETGPEGSLLKTAEENCKLIIFPHLRRSINPAFDLAALWSIFWFLKREKFTLIHTHSSKAGIIGRFAAKLAGVPVIIHTIHGLPFFKEQNSLLNFFYIFLERLAGMVTTRIVCVSSTIQREAIQANIAPENKFLTIHSGIDFTNYKPDPARRKLIRDKLLIPEDSFVVGKIARLFDLKGHEYLLQSAAQIKPRIKNLKILLIGDGILKPRLTRLAQALGIADMVIFCGLIPPDDIPAHIEAIDVLAHASLHEGLPRAIVQAMAMAKPVVCFDVDGAKDVIKDKETGFLSPAKDVFALAERIIRIWENPDSAKIIGERAQAQVLKKFSKEVMVEALHRLYENEVAKCGI